MFDLCGIRSVTYDDLSMILTWRNHPDTRRFMLTQHEISLDEHRNWFAKVSKDSTRCQFVIEEDRLPIGYVQFSNAVRGGVADWGFYARPDAPKGSGAKIGVTALSHAFGSLCVHKVCGQAIDGNQASIALHKKLGFTQEGTLREQQRIEGVYHTLVCFGLLAHEWQDGIHLRGNAHAQDRNRWSPDRR